MPRPDFPKAYGRLLCQRSGEGGLTEGKSKPSPWWWHRRGAGPGRGPGPSIGCPGRLGINVCRARACRGVAGHHGDNRRLERVQMPGRAGDWHCPTPQRTSEQATVVRLRIHRICSKIKTCLRGTHPRATLRTCRTTQTSRRSVFNRRRTPAAVFQTLPSLGMKGHMSAFIQHLGDSATESDSIRPTRFIEWSEPS